jgi:hypothetical protein
MRTAVWLLVIAGAVFQRPPSTSEVMVKTIYPSSDAIFYIETRTPANDTEWTALQSTTERLADAAASLTTRYARDRERWLADAKLLVDVSAKAIDAARARNVAALAALNDELYASCVTCHQHYRPNYPARSTSATPSDGALARDLEGVWSFATLTPLERPSEFAGKATLTDAEAAAYEKQVIETSNRDRRGSSPEADVGGAYNEFWWDRGTHVATVRGRHLTSLIVDPPDGRLPPLTAAAQARAAARNADRRDHPADGPENRSLGERCLMFNAGPPMLPGPYNNYVEIHHMGDHVVIFNEMIHDARIVPLDGRPHVPPTIRKWLGDSVGRWDGNTLVVDTTNFTDRTSVRGSDENLHLTERFTRVDAETLLYEFTIDNPTAFTKPWSASLPMTRTNDRVFEYACHEGNYALENILRGARYEERRD